ncbi:protein CC2D2B isoform X2 [Lissotriton helveticus]
MASRTQRVNIVDTMGNEKKQQDLFFYEEPKKKDPNGEHLKKAIKLRRKEIRVTLSDADEKVTCMHELEANHGKDGSAFESQNKTKAVREKVRRKQKDVKPVKSKAEASYQTGDPSIVPHNLFRPLKSEEPTLETEAELSDADEQARLMHVLEVNHGKDGSAFESQNKTKAVREKVRRKLKDVKPVKSKVEASYQTGEPFVVPHNLFHPLKSEEPTLETEAEEEDDGYSFFVSDGGECSLEFQASQSIAFPQLDEELLHEEMQICADKMDPNVSSDSVEEAMLPSLLDIKPAEYKCNKLECRGQETYIFVPSSDPVGYRFKLPEDTNPRNIEDEGLYVQRRPEFYRKCINKMERRLLQEPGGNTWFEISGEIISLPSPIKETWAVWKHDLTSSLHPALETVYIKAMKSDQESCIITSDEDQTPLYQLELNISNLCFSHHPLFSKENVLAAKLIQLHEAYQHRRQHNITHSLMEKLDDLVNAVRKMENTLQSSQLNKKELEECQCQIRDTQSLLDIEEQKDASLKHNMVKVWKQIKSLRMRQGYVNTPVKLQFKKRLTMIDQSEAGDCRKQISPTGIPQEDTEKMNVDSDLRSGQLDNCIKFEEHFQQMAKSRTIKAESWRREKCQREPNDATLIPCLTMNADVTPHYYCPEHEKIRRDKIRKQWYLIKMIYNGKQVFRTGAFPLNMDFKVEFRQLFSIQILNWPEHICLEIHEVTTKEKHMLAKLYLPLPDKTFQKGKDEFEPAEFSNDMVVIPEFEEVGSNVSFCLDGRGKKELCLLTSGKLWYSLCWAVDDAGVPLAPAPHQMKGTSYSLLKVTCLENRQFSSKQTLPELDKQVRIDPNDPRCSHLAQFNKNGNEKKRENPGYFRLNQLQEEFNFATDEEIQKCLRFQLLMHRNSQQLDPNWFQQIPLYDKEIPESLIQEYERQQDNEVSLTDKDPIPAQRANAATLIRKIRKVLMNQILKSKHRINLEDMVNEYDKCTSASQLSLAIFTVAEPRRHLRPQRKERKMFLTQILNDGDVKLLVRISRAFNIPVRKQEIEKPSAVPGPSWTMFEVTSNRHMQKKSQTNIMLDEVTVYPFIEVSFQNAVYHTCIAAGCNPCWNEELQLVLKSPNGDYSFSSLSNIKDKVYINIFDEEVVEQHEDDCQRGCITHSYMKKNWLGCVTFPFTSLLHQSKISGTFQVNMPPALLGYTWSSTYAFPNEDIIGQDLMELSIITIFATIDPNIASTGQDLEKDSEDDLFWTSTDLDDDKLLQIAYSFRRSCKELFPQRRIVTTVFSTEGQNMLVTKYIMAMNPPENLAIHKNDLQLTCELTARFVSLIPCLADIMEISEAFEYFPCWMTCEQNICWAVGNKEEHAVLLCNYFLFFKKKAYVLLGTSMLEGPVAYVLTDEHLDFFLWNPMNGQYYKQFDIYCPLQSVDCLIGTDNVWFNVQQNSAPMSVKFDLSREALWKPLFSKNFQHPDTPTLQPPEIVYVPTDKHMVEELEKRVERTLKHKLMEWRSKHPTRWNRQCIAIFRKILPKLEFTSASGASMEECEFKCLKKDYKLDGFPLRLPYTDIPTITQAVYNTGIHVTEIPNTEFAVSVYIYPYPNNILAVWVYLASLVPLN